MKKPNKKLIAILSIIAAAIFISDLLIIRAKKHEAKGDLIAKVNGEAVYSQDLQDFIANFLNARMPIEVANLTDEQKTGLLTQYGVERMIHREAEHSEISLTPEVKKKIAAMESAIIKEAYLDKLANDHISEESIRARYQTKLPELKAKTQGKKEYHASHILVKSAKEAQKISKSLTKENFANLAKQHSIDDASKINGGNLGFFPLDNMIKDFATQIEKLSPGEISKPFATDFGWHIVRLHEIRDAAPASFAKMRASIKQELYYEALQKHISEISKEVNVQLKN